MKITFTPQVDTTTVLLEVFAAAGVVERCGDLLYVLEVPDKKAAFVIKSLTNLGFHVDEEKYGELQSDTP